MDINTLLATGGASGGTIAILVLLYKVCQKIINHRIVAQCCNKECEVGISVEDYNAPNSNDKERPLIKDKCHPIGESPTRQTDIVHETQSGITCDSV